MKTDKKASLPQRDINHNPLAIIHEIDRLATEKIKTFAPPIPRSCQMIMMHLARKDNVRDLPLIFCHLEYTSNCSLAQPYTS
jgi:hypothetical protein